MQSAIRQVPTSADAAESQMLLAWNETGSRRSSRGTSARMVVTLVNRARTDARAKRARVFLEHFEIWRSTRILDLGSENGEHIASVLAGTPISPSNVYIADIDSSAVLDGHRRFGFEPVHIPESGRLPFDDGFFDIVYCSSVLEHVTVLKSEVCTLRDGAEFARRAWERQRAFAREIVRLCRGYFVQTPCRSFSIESLSCLPFVAYLPRPALVPLLETTNRLWVKKTQPDWRLLSEGDMRRLF